MTNYTVWGLIGPATWPWWLASLAFLLSVRSRWRRATPAVAGLAFAAFVVLAILPTGHWLAEPLERRFPQPQRLDPDISHIIVLAGAERLAQSARRGAPEVSDAGERIIDGAALARALPGATLWIVGGVRYRDSPITDADWTARSWQRLGVPPRRIHIVRHSLNTWENARRVAEQQPQGRILLVTSAMHMPRAVACFRAAGLDPLPFPVDYLSPPVTGIGDLFRPGLLKNIELADRALHEWVGLLLYRVQGRTRGLLPG